MQYRKILLTFMVVILCFFLMIVTGCDTDDSVIPDPIEPEEIIEEEQIKLSEEDFTFEIKTLPYRGAVLFINYEGEENLSEYYFLVDILSDGEIKQEKMAVEEVDGNLVVTIVDLMYLPGDELDFIITIKDDAGEVMDFYHSEVLERYPWKDWIFDNSDSKNYVYVDPLGLHIYNPFKYDFPDCSNQLGTHASWDLYDGGKMLDVYSGTVGVVYMTFVNPRTGGDVRIYNPHVGAIVQYGHMVINDEISIGKDVKPGDHLGNVLRPWDHIHYSVIRPYSYVRDMRFAGDLRDLVDEEKWEGYYWPIPWDIDGHYHDPFYWHEPTTLGYWYEDTLPEGLKEDMIRIFERENPGVVLPATEPLEPLD